MEKISVNNMYSGKGYRLRFMDINNMRNMVILKDLPSNLIDEAFVILKNNQKIKKFEYVESKSDNFSDDNCREDEDNFVVKEAELLISNYITKLENQDLLGKKCEQKIMKKYKKLKLIALSLGGLLMCSIFYICLQ